MCVSICSNTEDVEIVRRFGSRRNDAPGAPCLKPEDALKPLPDWGEFIDGQRSQLPDYSAFIQGSYLVYQRGAIDRQASRCGAQHGEKRAP